MGEAVPSGRNFGHETGATRLLQSVEKRFVAKSPGRLNYSQVELSTHNGRHPKGLVGILGKARHPATDDVPDALGDAELLDWTPCHPAPLQLAQPAGLRQMADDLAHEERIALRLGVDGPSQNHGVISVELVTGRLLHEGDDARGVESGEREALHAARTPEVGHHLHKGMVVVELGIPIGAEDEEALRIRGLHDMPQQEESGLGRPLQVVEDQEDRVVSRDCSQPGGHGVEETVALGLWVGPKR